MNNLPDSDRIIKGLRKVSNRSDLEKEANVIRQYDEIDYLASWIIAEIDIILSELHAPFRGMDDEIIQHKCRNLADKAANHLQKLSESSEETYIEQSLKYFAEYGFQYHFSKPGNKNCSYSTEISQILAPKNEYDVQHLLYCFFRVLFEDCRIEVSQDEGYKTVRSDIQISDCTIIEIKSTQRKSADERKIIEEICADFTRFCEPNHFFFIFDPDKKIKDKSQFKTIYEKKGNQLSGKKIRIFLYQG